MKRTSKYKFKLKRFEKPEEYEKNAPASAGIFGKVNIEFWDVSGDWRYEKCWGPIQKGAHGIIFVLDPASPHGEDQLVQFQRTF